MTPVPMPMPVMAPVHLFGLEVIDIVLADDRRPRGLAARRREALLGCDRRQWRGIRSRSKHAGARNSSKGEF
jgi:hypothetical protein